MSFTAFHSRETRLQRRNMHREEEELVFCAEPATKVYYSKAASPENMQRSVPETGSEPWATNPRCIVTGANRCSTGPQKEVRLMTSHLYTDTCKLTGDPTRPLGWGHDEETCPCTILTWVVLSLTCVLLCFVSKQIEDRMVHWIYSCYTYSSPFIILHLVHQVSLESPRPSNRQVRKKSLFKVTTTACLWLGEKFTRVRAH